MNMADLSIATTVLAAWNIEPEGELKEIHPARVFRVAQMESNDLLLKDVGDTPVERLLFEFGVLEHLADSGVPVAVPLKTSDGEQVVAAQGTRFTLSPCLITDSDSEPSDWEDRLASYGEAFARLHLALASYPEDDLARKTWSSNPLKESLDRCIPRLLRSLSKEQAAKLSGVRRSIEADMRDALEDLPVQLIHRDLHAGNVLCSGDRVVGIVDCDNFSIGSPMIDIAYFLHHTVKWLAQADGTMVNNEGGTKWWLSWMPRLIQAYHQVRPLSAREMASLPYMMIWVMLMFADMYCKQGNHDEIQAYLNLLDFVAANRCTIAQTASTPA